MFCSTSSFVFLVLVVALPAAAEDLAMGWTISTSTTDPYQNSGGPTGEQRHLYLWWTCAPLGACGGNAAEFDVVAYGEIVHLATVTMNGWLNAGGTANLLLVDDCGLPTVVARLDVLDLPGKLCIEPSVANGWMVHVDCCQNLYDVDAIGYDNTGATPCQVGPVTCEKDPTATNTRSWAHVKGLYR